MSITTLHCSDINMVPHAEDSGKAHGQEEDEAHPSIFAPLEPGISDAAAKEELPKFPS